MATCVRRVSNWYCFTSYCFFLSSLNDGGTSTRRQWHMLEIVSVFCYRFACCYFFFLLILSASSTARMAPHKVHWALEIGAQLSWTTTTRELNKGVRKWSERTHVCDGVVWLAPRTDENIKQYENVCGAMRALWVALVKWKIGKKWCSSV